MDNFDETGVDETDKKDEKGPALEDRGWDHISPNRNHTDALLEISEDYMLRDQEPYKYPSFSGLEEAVHGWGRACSLACIFQSQKKGKKPEHHCLLCADMRPLSPERTAKSPEPRSDPHTLDSGLAKSPNLPSSLSTSVFSRTAEAAPAKNDPEGNVQDLSLPQMLKLRRSLQQSSSLQPHLETAYSVVKDRNNGLVYSINIFTVLPPVNSVPLCPVQPVSGQATAEKETSEADGITCARESRDVERREETKAHFVEKPEPLRDTYGATLASKYYICQHNRQLLSAYRASIPHRCFVPLVPIADSRQHTSFSMDRHLKQGLRSGSVYSRQMKQAMSELPVIFGTKLLMPISAQRPL